MAHWVGQVKGMAAHAVNNNVQDLEAVFQWQDGCGVVTFGEKQLPFVQDYIARQKTHHANGTTFAKLERIEEQ